MKPNFALSLSVEGVRLLLRAAGGWRLVGEAMPDAEGFADELAVLRKTATSLAPDGLRCKLVIPNAQIRYLTIESSAMTSLERRDAARQALDGATPYAVDRLAFDVFEDGDVTHIAAVAYETLDEAEAFAEQHRFHPVSFVAIPGDEDYPGEPFFGPTKAAGMLLSTGQVVEPDDVSIVVIGETQASPPVAVTDPVEITSPSVTSPHIKVSDAASRRDRPGGAPAGFRTSQKPAQDMPNADVPPVDVPQDDLTPQTAAFSSRRKPSDADQTEAIPLTPPQDPMRGFAEPAAPALGAPTKARSVRARAVVDKAAEHSAQIDTDNPPVFGAREKKPRRGAPLYLAFVLTVALLVFLAGVAVWASGFVQDGLAGFFDRQRGGGIESEAVQVSPPIAQPAPSTKQATSSQMALAVGEADLSDEDAAVLDALRIPLTEENVDGFPISADQDNRSNYAVTGIWPQAPTVPQPPALIAIDDLYVASIDPIEPAFDAVALPPLAAVENDIMLDDPGSPAAAGTVFAFDARGLVSASPQGTPNPDGISIFAGAPPRRPAVFPSRDAPVAVADPAPTALAGFRPRLRPDDLKETTERATLDGLTRSELAQYRPPVRPALEVQAAIAAAAASLVPLDTPSAPGAQPDEGGLTLAASRRPDARPSNFNQIVAGAQKAAAPAASVSAASIAPQTVTPKIPSSASVTREATVRNAINLRKVNLIGVYGTPSDRRALVRLSNGGYKKVQVGDQIDGGRISAIGDSELRYQKRGRNLVLKMPKG